MPSTEYDALPRHGPQCICKACRSARRRSEYLSWAAYRPPIDSVPSDSAAAHIAQLRRIGMTQEQIARAAGVSTSTVSQAKVQGVRILASTADAILAVKGQSRR